MAEQIGPFEMYNEVQTARGVFGLRPGEYINEDGIVVSPEGTQVVEPVTVDDPELMDDGAQGQTISVGTANESEEAAPDNEDTGE
jgi:hypothetical protein